MQINMIAAKIIQVPISMLVVFFKDHQIIIPRSVRYKTLKKMVLDEVQSDTSEIWNYFKKEAFYDLEPFCELELEQILFVINESSLLPKFKKLFWQEVISNQFVMGVDDRFFNELALLASADVDKGMSFKEYYHCLNDIVADTTGLVDGVVFQNLIKRVKNIFTYQQVLYFIIKYQYAKENDAYNHIIANQILKTIEQTDFDYVQKKSALYNASTECINEIALSMKIDLSESSKDQYAREFLIGQLEHKDEIKLEGLSDEEMYRVLNHFIPLDEMAKMQIATDEKARRDQEFKEHLETENAIISNLINYNKNTNLALDLLKHHLSNLESKNKELSERVDILSKATGVAFTKNYRLKKVGIIALKVLILITIIVAAIYLFWYLYTHDFKDQIDKLFNRLLSIHW